MNNNPFNSKRPLPNDLLRCGCGRLYKKPYVGFGQGCCEECAAEAYAEFLKQTNQAPQTQENTK